MSKQSHTKGAHFILTVVTHESKTSLSCVMSWLSLFIPLASMVRTKKEVLPKCKCHGANTDNQHIFQGTERR